MRHPQLYASRLRKAAEEMPVNALKLETEKLAQEWQELAFKGGELMMRTYQLTGREIDEWPWVIPAHPSFTEFHANILKNDVT